MSYVYTRDEAALMREPIKWSLAETDLLPGADLPGTQTKNLLHYPPHEGERLTATWNDAPDSPGEGKVPVQFWGGFMNGKTKYHTNPERVTSYHAWDYDNDAAGEWTTEYRFTETPDGWVATPADPVRLAEIQAEMDRRWRMRVTAQKPKRVGSIS